MDNLQLPLVLGPKDSTAFESYFPGPNREALEYLRQLKGRVGAAVVYLWGPSGTGKSHLLQAACYAASAQDMAAVYLPMRSAGQFPCEALQGMENIAIVCIDDVQAIAGQCEWEIALIHLFERIHGTDGELVVAGATAPTELGLELPQLASRLAGGLMFQLRHLDDADKLRALQLRAARRGFGLPAEAGRYLLRQCGHDMNTLFEALNVLDRASLTAQRKITVPFVRAALREAGLAAKG